MNYRKFDIKKDKDAVFRILNEVGWSDDKKECRYLNEELVKANAIVTEINGEAEIMVVSAIGEMKYLDEDLKVSAVTGVTASLIARKQGLSGRLTAHKLAEDALAGCEIASLSIFDQGYYNKLGFGNGDYDRIVGFTPENLQIKRKPKPPIRLSSKDLDSVYSVMQNRMKCHGAVTLPKYVVYTEMWSDKKCMGFGYKNEKGELTHFLWMNGKGKEFGPIWISMMGYQNLDQLIDLLALLKSFEEQFRLIRMPEPAFIHIQDFLKRPFLMKNITKNSKYESGISSLSLYQHRILNLEKCMAKTHLDCEPFSFNLKLSDPIEKYLDRDDWNGIAGDYRVSIGNSSKAEKGFSKELPTLECSVNDFTRMWLGIMPASSLTISGTLSAPKELLSLLDKAFNLPEHHPDFPY